MTNNLEELIVADKAEEIATLDLIKSINPDTTNKQIIALTEINTPIGMMMVGVTKKGVCILEFAANRRFLNQLQIIMGRNPFTFSYKKTQQTEAVKKQVTAYFDGNLKDFDIPLDFVIGTEFQKKAWKTLLKVPYGTTRTYGEQAKFMKQPKAIRAVGNANGRNPIAIIVPCHRLVGKNGKLTGYGGGIWRKKWLIEMEKARYK